MLHDDVYKALREDAQAMGVQPGAYVSMLVMKARTERQAINFVSTLTPEQIRKTIDEQRKEKSDD